MPADYAESIGFILDNLKADQFFTASPGGAQGSGQLPTGFTRINVVATDGDAVTLPTPRKGVMVILLNDDLGQFVQVFPQAGHKIDDGTTDASVLLFAQQTMVFVAASTTSWFRRNIVRSTDSPVTANPSKAQGDTVLIAEYNEVSTVAADDDSVTLPEASAGGFCYVKNADDKILRVHPFVGDNIDELGVDVFIQILPGDSAIFFGVNVTKWFTHRSVSQSASTITVQTGIVAFVGGGQGSATQLDANADWHDIDIVGNIGDSVKLPPAIVGENHVVHHDGISEMTIYPSTGELIDQFPPNGGMTFAANQTKTFFCLIVGEWAAT